MPFLNRCLGTPLLSALIRLLYGLHVSDCNSGMRAFRRSTYAKLDLRCPGMEYASEMLIRLVQHRISYLEVPISFRKDKRGHAPHMRRWQHGWRHLRFIIGNAPSTVTIVIPGILSSGLLAIAGAISFQGYWDPAQPIKFHSAFIAVAMAMPPALFALASFLLKSALHVSGVHQSRLVAALETVNDNAAPFFAAAALFFCAFLESAALFIDWYKTGFGDFFQIAPLIRIMIYTFIGSAFFSMDLGLGLIRLTSGSRTPLEHPDSERTAKD